MTCELEKIKPAANRKLKLDIAPTFADATKTVRTKLDVHWAVGGESRGKVLAIGINPSKAGQTNQKSDKTATKLARFLDMYGFDNFTIINLFENVSSDGSIDFNSVSDFEKYRVLFKEAAIILVVWGVKKNKYAAPKTSACDFLTAFEEKLYCIQNGNGKFPGHPSRMCYQACRIKKCSAADLRP